MHSAPLYDNEHTHNPLDHVEDVLNGHNWTYERMNSDELVVDVAGDGGKYRLLFLWQEPLNSLQIYCQYDLVIAQENLVRAYRSLSEMNRSLWLGHFEISTDTMAPCFRYTSLLHGYSPQRGQEYIEDLVDIALTQCERYFSAFQMLGESTNVDNGALSLAIMETVGES